MKIDYSILTNSKMLIKVGEKEMYITGEGTTIPSFYADIKSMKKWEEPYENEMVTVKVTNEIIDYITKESEKRGIPVIFD